MNIMIGRYSNLFKVVARVVLNLSIFMLIFIIQISITMGCIDSKRIKLPDSPPESET